MWGETKFRGDPGDQPKKPRRSALGIEQLDLSAIADMPDKDAATIKRDPEKTAQVKNAQREQLEKLAASMLIEAGDKGIGFDEVRNRAVDKNILTGEEDGRFLSFGAAMMKKLGGVPVKYRKSRAESAQRRRVAVYVHKSFHPTAISLAE